MYSYLFTIFQKWHKWHGKSYGPLNTPVSEGGPGWPTYTQWNGNEIYLDFFSPYINTFLDVMKLPILLEFHDTQNDNCNKKNLSYVQDFQN